MPGMRASDLAMLRKSQGRNNDSIPKNSSCENANSSNVQETIQENENLSREMTFNDANVTQSFDKVN